MDKAKIDTAKGLAVIFKRRIDEGFERAIEVEGMDDKMLINGIFNASLNRTVRDVIDSFERLNVMVGMVSFDKLIELHRGVLNECEIIYKEKIEELGLKEE